MQKTIILTLTFLSFAILPVMAQFDKKLDVGEIWTDFQSYSSDLQSYLQNNLTENLRPVEPQTQSGITGATGDLNLPNPIKTGQYVRDQMILYSIADRFENNSAVRSNLVSNEINRLITRGAVASILGENGQVRTKTKLRNTEISLRQIAGFADEAEDQSQSLLEKIPINIDYTKIAADPASALIAQLLGAGQAQMLKIQQEQSKITAETLGQTIQANQSLQYSNLNLANISQQVEQENRDRRINTATEAARLLRTTSQADLFGRKE